MIVKLLTEHHLEFLSSKRGCRGPITSFSFRPQHYFYWLSPFSLESHLTGKPCDYFLLSFIIAQNYVLACIFCIVWCQQISIHTLYPGCNIFVYIADQKQPNTSRAWMDCGKLTLFLLLQTLKRRVASQDFAEKHSLPTFMFRHK